MFLFGNSPTGQTHRQILALDGKTNADSCNGVPFSGLIDTARQLAGQLPQILHFGGVNRHFEAKPA